MSSEGSEAKAVVIAPTGQHFEKNIFLLEKLSEAPNMAMFSSPTQTALLAENNKSDKCRPNRTECAARQTQAILPIEN